MNQFKEGDVVCLKSDKAMVAPQRMTINFIGDDDTCECVWAKDGEIRRYSFYPEALTLCD